MLSRKSLGVATSFGILFILAVESFAQSSSTVDEDLREQIEPLVKSHAGAVGLAIRNLKTGEHYEYNERTPMPTASLIKFPIMLAAYQLRESGKLNFDTPIELREEDKVPGSGILTAHFSPGIKLPLEDYIRLMIRYSDNTATNVVIDQIGLAQTSKWMGQLGFGNTKLHSKVFRGDTSIHPERSKKFGIGSTTAAEMVELFSRFEKGELANPELTEAMQKHLQSCEDDTKIAAGLPAGVAFAHKTGALANCRTDAGVITTPAGKVAVCLLTNRNEDQSWADHNEAHRLASRIGAIIVDRFGDTKQDPRLREGSFGKLVEALQRTLNDRLDPSPQLSVDGDFGPATRAALERFQRLNTLEVNGIVGTETWNALGTLLDKEEPVMAPEVANSQKFPVQPQPDLNGPPIVTAKAWVIADANSGEVLFEHDSAESLNPASTTKIMTAYLVLKYAAENPSVLEEIVEFSKRADETRGSTSGLRQGERVSVRDLLYGLLLPSGNDASVALAEHFGARLQSTVEQDPATSYASFVAAMNKAASDLKMGQSYFENTHGLTSEAHLLSARDLIRLTRAALKFDLFRKIIGTHQYGTSVNSVSGYKRNVLWKNTNRLLGYENFSGVKTGTTSAAGACLVALGKNQGREFLVVVLGSSSSDARYADTRNLFHWIWKRAEESDDRYEASDKSRGSEVSADRE